MAALRSWVVRKYVREVMAAGARAQLAFFDKYRLVWPVSAFIWGASTWLFFDRSPLADQFICWLVLAGLAMFSINSLSSHLRTLLRWLDTLLLTSLCVIMWRVAIELQFKGPFYHWWVI